MTRYILICTGAGLASGILCMSLSGGSLITAILLCLTPLPLFIAGLSFGAIGALIAAGAAYLLTSLFGGITAGFAYLCILGAPCAWLCRQALLSRTFDSANTSESRTQENTDLEWYPVGYLLTWICGIALTGLLLTGLIYMGEGGLKSVFIDSFQAHPNMGPLIDGAVGEGWTRETFIEAIASIAPAMAGIFWSLIMFGNLLLANAIARRSGIARRPTFDFADMVLPDLVLIGFALALATVFFSGQAGFLGASAAAILAFPYFLLGLAVVHAISRAWPARVWILAFMYFCLLIQGPHYLVLLGLGLLEPWLGLRKKFG